MMRKNLNTNKYFMVGNGLLAFAVFIIVALFIYLSFRYQRRDDAKISYEGKYHIEISNDFAGDSIAVYINDSLLLGRTMPDGVVKLTVDRFAEESALIVVDGATVKASPFSLSDKGSRIKITRNNGVVYMLETEN